LVLKIQELSSSQKFYINCRIESLNWGKIKLILKTLFYDRIEKIEFFLTISSLTEGKYFDKSGTGIIWMFIQYRSEPVFY
jgi:hypothetical protein